MKAVKTFLLFCLLVACVFIIIPLGSIIVIGASIVGILMILGFLAKCMMDEHDEFTKKGE